MPQNDEDPASRGNELVTVQASSGMQDIGVLARQTRDRAAGDRRGRVSLRGQDDAHRVLGAEPQAINRRQIRLGRCQHDARQRRFEQAQQGLGLRVAEPHVELDDLGAGTRQGQADVQQTDEGGSLGLHLRQGGHDDLLAHLVHEIVRRPGQRGVGPHATGVGAGAVVADPFEVLGRLHRQGTLPIADGEQAHLRSVKELLDDNLVTCLQAVLRMVKGLIPILGDDDSLAAGEPVILDDVWSPETIQRLGHLVQVGADAGRGSRHSGVGHDLLGEGLGSLQTSSSSAGTETRDPGCTQGICHASDQRGLRADDDEVGLDGARQVDDGGQIGRTDIVIDGERGSPGVAGGHVHLPHLGIAGACQGKRMFAPARAENENCHLSHGSRLRGRARFLLLRPRPRLAHCGESALLTPESPGDRAQSMRLFTATDCSRPGPTPMPEIRHPMSSSSRST